MYVKKMEKYLINGSIMEQIDNPRIREIIGKDPIILPKTVIDFIPSRSIDPVLKNPVVNELPPPIIRGIEIPVIDVPSPSFEYPTLDIPTEPRVDGIGGGGGGRKSSEEDKEDTRELPDSPIESISTPPPPSININGIDITLPEPSIVATAAAVAIVTTATTMIANVAFNSLKNAAEPILKEAKKKKFKVKLKRTKPVLHYVLSDKGHIDVLEYSAEGTRLVDQIDNVEQYIRDQVEANSLYEIENKVIIDDVIISNFTKEGKERFKSLFVPAQKFAKKLSSKFSF